MKRIITCLALTLCLVLSAFAGKPAYLFSYFIGNSEDGLHLAYSYDGLTWTPLNEGRSFLTPAVGKDKLMRDPSICQSPDGTFHMVWTSSWTDRIIGYASSRDLIHWEHQPIALYPDELGFIFSGSAVYDTQNSSEYGTKLLGTRTFLR